MGRGVGREGEGDGRREEERKVRRGKRVGHQDKDEVQEKDVKNVWKMMRIKEEEDTRIKMKQVVKGRWRTRD